LAAALSQRLRDARPAAISSRFGQRSRVLRPKIPCKLPYYQAIEGRDAFARDCIHRQIVFITPRSREVGGIRRDRPHNTHLFAAFAFERSLPSGHEAALSSRLAVGLPNCLASTALNARKNAPASVSASPRWRVIRASTLINGSTASRRTLAIRTTHLRLQTAVKFAD